MNPFESSRYFPGTVCRLIASYFESEFKINNEFVKNVQSFLWNISFAKANVFVSVSIKTELPGVMIVLQYLPMDFFSFIVFSYLIDIGFSLMLFCFLFALCFSR